MKNELQSLSNLIGLPITKHYHNHEQRKLEFKYECNIIKDMILQKVFASDAELKTRVYLRYHHKELIAIMDRFYLMCSDVILPESFFEPMNDLLQYLEHHFKDDLDWSIHISQFTLSKLQQKIEHQKQQLVKSFRKNEINTALINVLLAHFKKLETQQDMSYTAYRYHCLFLVELARFSIKRSKRNYSDHLYILLGRLNFNNIHFMAHCRNQILEALQKTDKKDSQIDILANYYKKIRLIQIDPNLSLNPTAPNVVEVLCTWINEEKVFVTNRKQKQGALLEETQLQEKIELDLSVGQLGLFLKVLMNSGLIANTQLTKVLNFFTAHFRTHKVNQISTESLRNNYYEVEANTISGLKARMIAMVNLLNQMKTN